MATLYLTREGYEKLQDELDYLRTVKRQEVADRLHEAIDGSELIEDAEYEAAKNEQAFVEGRILELEGLLANAKIVEKNGDSSFVQIASRVTIQEEGGEPEEYVIVSPVEANPREGKISDESPLGKALMGHEVGDEVEVVAPNGSYKVKIINIE